MNSKQILIIFTFVLSVKCVVVNIKESSFVNPKIGQDVFKEYILPLMAPNDVLSFASHTKESHDFLANHAKKAISEHKLEIEDQFKECIDSKNWDSLKELLRENHKYYFSDVINGIYEYCYQLMMFEFSHNLRPLSIAIHESDIEFMKLLIDRGASIDLADEKHRVPLHYG